MEELSWDVLRDVLSIARNGSIRAAARARGQSHATVSRHLMELEARLRTKVMVRAGRGIELTEVGWDIARAAESVETEVLALARRLEGREVDVSGTVRIALPPVMVPLLAPALARLSARWPKLCVELATGVALSRLTHREADIAVRVQTEPDEHLVGRRLGPLPIAPYRARSASFANGPVSWPWLDWNLEFQHLLPSRWLSEHVPNARIVARVSSGRAMLDLIHAGVGVGILPTMVGEPDPQVIRCDAPSITSSVLWVLTHPDLRGVPRVRVVMQELAAQIEEQKQAPE